MNKISNLIPITLSLSSIGILFYIFLPLITSEFIIINESIAIPDFNTQNRILVPDKTIEENIIIQILGGFKILEGFFFHHHMTFLLPAYYIDIGIDRNIHQYGILTTYIIYFCSIQIFNEISFNAYLSIIHSFLILFPLVLMYLGLKIYQNKYLVFLFVLVFTLSYILLDFLNFYLTPTVSPIRQIFIPIIFYFLYKVYYERKTNFIKYFYLFLILQTFVFIELSLFIIFSVIFQIFIDKKIKLSSKENLLNFIFLFLVLYIFLFNNFNDDNYFSTFNFIFLGPSLKFLELSIIIVLLCILMYIVSSSVSDSKSHIFIKIISCYSMLSIFYYVWNPSYNHLAPIIWPISLITLFFIDRFIIFKKFTTSLVILSFVAIFTTYYAINNFYTEKELFYGSLTRYLKNYELKIDNKINMSTTINPVYIQDSCRIIDKHNNKKMIHLISIHDSFLPFLCNKANAKYDQLILNMVNEDIKNNAYNSFKDKKIIFVDNYIDDIKSNTYYEIYEHAVDFRIKINAINQARKLFKELKNNGNYKLVERGKLISVYEKID